MKKHILTLLVLFIAISTQAQTVLSKEERKAAIQYLTETMKEVKATIKGLSEEQLNFKPDESTWSVSDCAKHIAITEKGIWDGMIQVAFSADPDPSKRSEIKMTDEQIRMAIESREQRVKTGPQAEPDNMEGSIDDVINAFESARKEHIKFVKTSKEDFRNRYAQTPLGTMDGYQALLLLAGHTRRHVSQMKEVMENTNFPK